MFVLIVYKNLGKDIPSFDFSIMDFTEDKFIEKQLDGNS